MVREIFKLNYRLQEQLVQDELGDVVIITRLIQRDNNVTLAKLKAVLDRYETNDLINLINLQGAQRGLNWDYLINMNRRCHVDYFFRILEVNDSFPLDTNTPITDLYT